MTQTDNGGLRGQVVNSAEAIGLLPLSENIQHVVGSAATVLTNSSKKQLYVFADKGAFNLRLGKFPDKTFTAATTDLITIASHGLESAAGPFFASNSGGGLPTGLLVDTPYYVIVIDANTIKLASSKANAIAEVAVDITGVGTGTHTLFGMRTTEFPAATTTNGSGCLHLSEGQSYGMTAPTNLTVKGYAADSVLSYFWV